MSQTDYLKIERAYIIKQWSLFGSNTCVIWIKYFESGKLNTKHGKITHFFVTIIKL